VGIEAWNEVRAKEIRTNPLHKEQEVQPSSRDLDRGNRESPYSGGVHFRHLGRPKA
jgi:hypothetical protein